MDVEIVSRETIRPSSPTPSHLRTFPLSLLDQLSPPFYVPVIYFFPTTTTSTNTDDDTHTNNNFDVDQILLHRLKLSLSEALSIFYPLAGRIKDHSSIDCNDEGVLFSQAKVNHCHLSEFLKQPKTELLGRFLPSLVDISMERLNEAFQVAIQVNIFAYGGISIGFCFFHRIIDATTMKAFLKCWSAIASGFHDNTNKVVATTRRGRRSPVDDITAAFDLFPARKSESLNDHHIKWSLKKEKGIRRRFVFDATAITALKAKVVAATGGEAVPPNLTRFQVVAGFIWKCAMSASRALGSQKPSVMMIPVNLRPKMVSPTMSENSIGNIFWEAITHHREEEEEAIELRSVVDVIRGAVKKINGDFITSLQGEQGFTVVSRAIEESREIYSVETPPEAYICSSWCGLGFYDVDFGWGKPIWIAYAGGDKTSNTSYPNSIILMDTMSGDGVEAWMLLTESHMEKLQGDQEFLTFATFNPSISINS